MNKVSSNTESEQLIKNDLMELMNTNENLNESLCLENWCFKSYSRLRKHRFKQISKKNLLRLSRAPFKYSLKNPKTDINEATKMKATVNFKDIKSKNKKILFKVKKTPTKFINKYKNNKIKKNSSTKIEVKKFK